MKIMEVYFFMVTEKDKNNNHAAARARMLLAQLAPNFLDPKHEWKRIFAELWGTFLLVLVAVGGPVVATSANNHAVDALLPVAPGVMVMAIIYFMGTVSGAHLNPAVTIAFAIRRNFPWMRVPGYILAQIAGGWLAALFLGYMFGNGAVAAGMTLPGSGVTPTKAFVMEIVLAAGLVNTILGTASGARNIGPNGAIAVGGYIAMTGLWASPVSGASMNPVRSLAPALVWGDLSLAWIYVVGPLAGALIGVLFEWILKGPPTTAGTIAAQGTLGIDDEEE
jgi:aquaporin Z